MATSYNGWPASEDKSAIGVQPFGDKYGLPFPGGVKAGDVAKVLGYVAAQLHYRVEKCVSGWDWGYTYKQNVNNPSTLSCHASGTAIDYNAPNHPNGSSGTFSSAQVGEIRQILAEVQGAVNWLEGYDEMHFEIAVGADTLARIAATLPATPSNPPPDEEDDVTDEDIEKIAKRTRDLILKETKIIRYNTVDNAGKETAHDGSLVEAVGSGTTGANRAAYRAL